MTSGAMRTISPVISACVVPDYGRSFRPSDDLERHRKADIMTGVCRALTRQATRMKS